MRRSRRQTGHVHAEFANCRSHRPGRVDLTIADDELHCLQALALNEASDEIASLLLRKLAGANLVNRFRMPLDVVALNCIAAFTLDGQSNRRRLAHPRAVCTEADLSVISSIGAALIGLRAGQATECADDQGVVRHLQVLSVEYPAGALEPAYVDEPRW